MKNDYCNTELQTADAQSWLFNVDELDAFDLDAAQKSKSAVSEAVGVRYSDLRSRLVNTNGLGDTYVVVVRVFDR